MPKKPAFEKIKKAGDTFMKENEVQPDDIVILYVSFYLSTIYIAFTWSQRHGTDRSREEYSEQPLFSENAKLLLSRPKFVNNVVQSSVAPTSDGFQTYPQLTHYIMPIPRHWATRYHVRANRRLVLVDTPGFDDTDVSDSEILRRIAVWLAAS